MVTESNIAGLALRETLPQMANSAHSLELSGVSGEIWGESMQ